MFHPRWCRGIVIWNFSLNYCLSFRCCLGYFQTADSGWRWLRIRRWPRCPIQISFVNHQVYRTRKRSWISIAARIGLNDFGKMYCSSKHGYPSFQKVIEGVPNAWTSAAWASSCTDVPSSGGKKVGWGGASVSFLQKTQVPHLKSKLLSSWGEKLLVFLLDVSCAQF